MGTVLNKQHPNVDIELTNLSKLTKSKSVSENQDDFEECILIWLDSTIRDTHLWIEELNHIRKIINNIKIFDNPNDCIIFMKMVVSNKIFLIVSHQYINLICSIKSELRCLTSIYVYCDENLSLIKRTHLETWAKTNEPLITDVYLKPIDCFKQLTKDVNDICDHDSIPVTYLNFQQKNFNLKQASSFIIFHLFLNNILFHLSSSLSNDNQQRQRIFRSCLYYYRDNDKYLEEINNFQQYYNSRSAIDWYLKTKFLSRLLNKAIRTENLSLLMDYSFIFNDIQYLINKKSSITEQIDIYYRAQNINTDDLYRLRMNLNGIISINRYLDLCKTAEQAINEISLVSNTLEFVLYHFSIDHSYISISDNKILLSIGTLFCIQHIGMEIDGIWHVHLNILKKDDIKDKIDILLNEIDLIPHDYLSIGLIWDKLKQTGKAERYYRLITEHLLKKKDHETAIIYNYIGAIFRLKCQYSSALNCHQQALLIYQEINKLNSSFNEHIDRTYAQIALVYRDMGDLFSAIEYFTLAIKLGEEILSSLGEIYRNLGQFNIAHQYYQQTKQENNIALCYIYQRMFPQALSHLKKETESIPYINLGVYHQLQKEYSRALIFYDKALELVKNHPLDTAMIHSYIGLLYCDQRQWLLSLKHYEQALDIYKRHLSTMNHPTIALIHDGLGTLYLNKGEYRAAQYQFQRCLELQLRVLPSKHPDIAGTYNNLGGVFNEMGHYEQALLYHYEALAIATATLPIEHFDVKLYEHNITETKRKLS